MNPNLQQVYHMVVVKDWKGTKSSSYDINANLTVAGDACFIYNSNTKEGRFVYRDNDTIKAGPLLSRADVFNVIEAYRTDPKKGNTPLTKYHKKITAVGFASQVGSTLESNDVATINLSIKNFLVVGTENTLLVQGFAQLHDGITKQEVILRLAKSLADAIKRNTGLGIEIKIGTITSAGVVTEKVSFDNLKKYKLVDLLTGGSQATIGINAVTQTSCVIIEETASEWELGKFNFERPDFSVSYQTINYGGRNELYQESYEWGKIDNYSVANEGIVNGYAWADIEYACQAMRGNVARKMNFPFSNYTQPLIDPTLEYESVIFDYSYQGKAEDIQKSPAQLYVVSPKTGGTIATIVSALESALGLVEAPAQSGSGS